MSWEKLQCSTQLRGLSESADDSLCVHYYDWPLWRYRSFFFSNVRSFSKRKIPNQFLMSVSEMSVLAWFRYYLKDNLFDLSWELLCPEKSASYVGSKRAGSTVVQLVHITTWPHNWETYIIDMNNWMSQNFLQLNKYNIDILAKWHKLPNFHFIS